MGEQRPSDLYTVRKAKWIARPQRIAQARPPLPVAPLQRALPFFRDPAHTRPTKWGLYRPLLRALGGAAALAAARAETSSSPSSTAPSLSTSSAPSTPTSAETSTSSTPAFGFLSDTPTATPSSGLRIPPARVLRGAGWLGAFQGTEPPAKATWAKPAIPAGFAPLQPLSGPYPHLLASLRSRWRTARGWTSMRDTRMFIEREEELLSCLLSSDAIVSKREDALAASLAAYEALPAPPPPPRPLLTGAYMRPTKFSPPLPRMKPQPRRISGMIASRVKKRELRILRLKEVQERQREIKYEVGFWKAMGVRDEWSDDTGVDGTTWQGPLQDRAAEIEMYLDRDVVRGNAMFPDDVIERVKAARRRRDTWRVNRSRKRRGLEPIWPEEKKEGNEEQGEEGEGEEKRPRVERVGFEAVKSNCDLPPHLQK